MPDLIRNRPSPEGRALGKELARLADAEPSVFSYLRCGTCAFRAGTVPNGCTATLLDAIKCAIEGVPFYCHEDKAGERPCAGWIMLRGDGSVSGQAPWPFSTGEGDA